MDPTLIKPRVCAEVPVLGKIAEQIVVGIDSGATLESLFPLVIDMAKELRGEEQTIGCENVIDYFEDKTSENHQQLRILFHTMNRQTLRSLLLGHIAYDLHDTYSKNWKNTYDKEGAGAYFIGISIEDRDGAFLNQKEIKTVMGHLEEYQAGCEAWTHSGLDDSYGQSQISPAQRLAIENVMLIDNEMLPEAKKWVPGDSLKEPRCMSGKKGVGNIEALQKMLRKRINEDFDENVYQTSSPGYVGCGRRMPRRLLLHDPDYGDMSQSSTVLKLLVACIRYMGLKPTVHTVPIMRVWEQAQIGLSEVLVTVLAQSLITIGGLNVIKPGTVTSSGDSNVDIYKKSKVDVWIMKPWFGENIDQSLDEMEGNHIYREALEKIQSDFMSETELEQLAEEIEKAETRLESISKEFNEAEEAARARLREAEEQRDRLDRIVEMGSGMFPDLYLSDDDDDDDDED
ncbi:hypothetical protein F4818DRAFT_416865 [Hypoxylon cercidicola]|nr:hypothetical protein F4818DRAFT_416865 [Hypoxylon cercidicola]